jgi:subtilisin
VSDLGFASPAWSRDSMVLRLPSALTLSDLSHDFVFGGADGRGVRVAVIDSGIDADHPGLDGCVDGDGAIQFSATGSDVDATVGPHGDDFGHGTACAGIIHALAPQARITSVKVLGAGLTGTSDVFLAGLRWAVDQRFDIINLSLGTRKRDWALAFHTVCDDAYFANSFIVTAANNRRATTYPSLFASVTSVACNTTTDPSRYHFNPEPPTEFLARGIDVPVLWTGHGATRGTGNSYAAPHIAGLAALIRSKHESLRPFQMKTALWARAANVVEAGNADFAGRLSRLENATSVRRAMSAADHGGGQRV